MCEQQPIRSRGKGGAEEERRRRLLLIFNEATDDFHCTRFPGPQIYWRCLRLLNSPSRQRRGATKAEEIESNEEEEEEEADDDDDDEVYYFDDDDDESGERVCKG